MNTCFRAPEQHTDEIFIWCCSHLKWKMDKQISTQIFLAFHDIMQCRLIAFFALFHFIKNSFKEKFSCDVCRYVGSSFWKSYLHNFEFFLDLREFKRNWTKFIQIEITYIIRNQMFCLRRFWVWSDNERTISNFA